MSKTKMAKANWRPILFNFLTGVYMCLIVGIPSLSALALFRSAPGLRDVTVILLPMEWSVCFVTVADLLSLPHQFAVKPGNIVATFPTAVTFISASMVCVGRRVITTNRSTFSLSPYRRSNGLCSASSAILIISPPETQSVSSDLTFDQ